MTEYVEDAWGNVGEQCECPMCYGTGVEYGETCVTCGGYGWRVENPVDEEAA